MSMRARRVLASLPVLAGAGLLVRTAMAEPPPAPPASSVAALANADAWIRQNPPGENHGTEATLKIGSPERARTLVRVDTATIQAALGGRRLLSARLEVTIQSTLNGWGQAPFGVDARTLDVHRLTRAWTETGATWTSPGSPPAWDMRSKDSPPFVVTPSGSAVIAAGQTGVLSFDVTAEVAGFLAGTTPNQGWLLKRRDEEKGNGGLELVSREAPSGGPRLVLERDVVPPTVTIVSPAEGAYVGSSAVARVTYSDPAGILAGSFVAHVGTATVTSAFAQTTSGAEATLASISTALVQGSNTLAVSVDDQSLNTGNASRTFRYDSIAPTLSLEPSDGAVVVSGSLTVRATVSDAGSGVDASSFALTVDGNPVALDVSTGVAQVDLALTPGLHALSAQVKDVVGNRAQVASHVLLAPRGVRGRVLGGQDTQALVPVAGARIRALDGPPVETFTGADGEFTLYGPAVGTIRFVADGYLVGHGRATFVMDVVDDVVTTRDRAVVLPVVVATDGVEVSLDASGRTTAEIVVKCPDFSAATLTIAPGTRIVLPQDGFTLPPGQPLRISMRRLVGTLEANPLPASPSGGEYVSPGLYVTQPEGLECVEGYSVTFPNEAGVAPGESGPYYLFSARTGQWELEAQLVASADGATVSGEVHSLVGFSTMPRDKAGLSESERSRLGIYNQQYPTYTFVPYVFGGNGVDGISHNYPLYATVVGDSGSVFAGPSEPVQTFSSGPTATKFVFSASGPVPDGLFNLRFHPVPSLPSTFRSYSAVGFLDRNGGHGTLRARDVGQSSGGQVFARSAVLYADLTDGDNSSVAGLYAALFEFDQGADGSYNSSPPTTAFPPGAPSVAILGNPGAFGPMKANGDLEVLQANGAQLQEGKYAFRIRLIDTAGCVTFVPDDTGIVVTIDRTSPQFQSGLGLDTPRLRRTPATISFNVSDSKSMDRVSLIRDDLPFFGGTITAPSSNFSASFPPEFVYGRHTYYVLAFDSAGNVTRADPQEFEYTFDNVGPATTISVSPSAVKLRTAQRTLHIHATDPYAGLSSYRVERAPSGSGAWATVSTGTFSGLSADFDVTDTAMLDEGRHVYRVVAVDTLGNEATSPISNELLVDSTPPTITITSPTSPIVGTGSFTFSANVGDALSALNPASIVIEIDGAQQTASLTPPAGGNITANATILRLLEGSHTVVVRAEDVLGNAATLTSTITQDHHRPVIDTFTPGRPTSVFLSASTTITWDAQYHDVGSAVDPLRVHVYLKSGGGPGLGAEVTSFATITALRTTFTSATPLPEGVSTLTLVISDEGGNTTTDTRSVFVDSIAPTSAITSGPNASPVFTNNRLPGFTASLTDTGLGVDPQTVKIFLDGAPVTNRSTVTSSFVLFQQLTPLADGPHDFRVEAKDIVGNAAPPLALPFVIDATGPTTPGLLMVGARPLEPVTTLRWIGSTDAGSGLQTYALLRTEDGREWREVLRTTALEAPNVPFPTGERTAFRVVAIDRAGNESAPAEAHGCEIVGLERLTDPVTTSLVVQIFRADGTEVSDAAVIESSTGTPLDYTTNGTYRSASTTWESGQPLNLRVLVDGVVFVSGPLLPLLPSQVETDFGRLVIQKNGTRGQVFGIAAQSPAAGGGPGLGATGGEPGAQGPPPAVGGGIELVAGFWNTVEVEGDPVINVLQTPPVLCTRYVPIYFEVVADLVATRVLADFSRDGGQTWSPMTLVRASALLETPSRTSPLFGTPNGRRYVAIWDVTADLADVALADCTLRFRPEGFLLRGDTIETTLIREFSVASSSPPSGAQDLTLTPTITLTFTQAPTTSIANVSSSIVLEDITTNTVVPTSFSVSGSQIAVTPTSSLVADHDLRLRVFPGLLVAGVPRAFDQDALKSGLDPWEGTFRVLGRDVTPPSLLSSNPPAGMFGVGPGTPILVTFNENLDPTSVGPNSVTLLSSREGVLTASVFLMGSDPRTLLVQPTAPLQSDRAYTVAVGPDLKDVAGNAHGRLEAFSFTTVTTQPGAPAQPLITSPAAGATIGPQPFVRITGTTSPNAAVRLYVDGLPTGVVGGADAQGAFSFLSCALPLGSHSLSVGAFPGSTGAPASALALAVPVTVFGPTPPAIPPGSPIVHEVLAGDGTHGWDLQTLDFTVSPGAPVSVQLDVPASSFVAPEGGLTIAGGGTLAFNPGRTTALAVADGTGHVLIGAHSSQVGQAPSVTVTDLMTNRVAPTQTVVAEAPVALVSKPLFTGASSVPLLISLGAREVHDQAATIVVPIGYDIHLSAIDENGQPTDQVTLDGQPGAAGIDAKTDANGNVSVTATALAPGFPFGLLVYAKDITASNEPGPVLLCESELLGSSTVSRDGGITMVVDDCPQNAPPYSGTTVSTKCDPCEKLAAITAFLDSIDAAPLFNPVILSSGGKVETRTDLAIPGRGLSFSFSRTYKSFALYSGPLGERWNHSYDQKLLGSPTTDVEWVTGGARQETFHLNGGTYTSPREFFCQLRMDGDVGTIRQPDGTRLVFRSLSSPLAAGRLDRILDVHGNALSFEYRNAGPGFGEIASVIDPLGRVVTFSYDRHGRLSTLRDFLGREVHYEYDPHGDLVRVTSPAVVTTTTGAPLDPGQQFPSGRQEVYGYTSGFADERLNHLLTHYVAPVEAEQLRGLTPAQLDAPAVLGPLAHTVTTYDMNPDDFSFCHVVKQRVGGSSTLPAWTGQTSPVEAGGELTAAYEPLPVPPGASLNYPVEKTTVIDRDKNLHEYFHNAAGQCVRLRDWTNRHLRPQSATPGEGQEPTYYERTWCYSHDGLPIVMVNPSGNRTRWIHGDEDLNGDGVLTAGVDTNGNGTFDDPEDVQPEDDALFAYAPGNGALDQQTLRAARGLLLITQDEPDARGDTRGGQRPRRWTMAYEPIYQHLRTLTNPYGNEQGWVPQTGGPGGPAAFTTTTFFDYQQSTDVDAMRASLAAELGVSLVDLDALLSASHVDLGLNDLNGSPDDDRRITGDVVRVEAPRVTLTQEQTLMTGLYGSQQTSITQLECNDLGQPVRVVDAEGNVHRFEYYGAMDPDGDGVPVPGVSSSRADGGYLRAARVDTDRSPGRDSGADPMPVDARVSYSYDPVGNAIAVVDARGVEHDVEFDPLNEVVRTIAAANVAGPALGEPAVTALRYHALLFYDADGRMVETRVSNAGERDGTANVVGSNPYWTRKTAYDLLGDPVISLAEVEPVAIDQTLTTSSPGVIVSRVAYTPGQQVALVTKPEGNQVAITYDERNMPFQVTDGFGSADAGTTTYTYTLNGGPQLIVSAVKHNSSLRTDQPTGDVTRVRYSGFDEGLCTTDPEGNCGDAVYDPCGRAVRRVRFATAEPSVPRLAEVEFFYDELGRQFRTDARVFTNGGSFGPGWNRTIPMENDPAPVGETVVTSIVEYDRLGRALRAVTPLGQVDPLGHDSLMTFDGAGRMTDASGSTFTSLAPGGVPVRNTVHIDYNQAGQPLRTTTTDRSAFGAVESFTSYAVYDALGRTVRATDPAGQTARLVYDSRSNVIAASDAKSGLALISDPLGVVPMPINDHGNVVHAYFDGIGRPLRSELLLKQGGVGNGQLDLSPSGVYTNLDTSNPANPDGRITIRQTYDKNSRLTSREDDNGNTTRYAYDSRDRAVFCMGADLTTTRTVYDRDSLPVQSIDRNGTVLQRSFDADGRVTKVEALRTATNLEGTGQAVEGTTVQAWEYDGLSRPRVCVDQNDPLDPSDDVATSYTYDSLSRQLTERHRFRAQTTVNAVNTQYGRITVTATGSTIDRTVRRTFDVDSNRETTTYGFGSADPRTLSYAHDGLDRVQRIIDGPLVGGSLIQSTEWIGGRPLVQDAGNGVHTAFGYEPQKPRLQSLGYSKAGVNVARFDYTWTRSDQRATETFSAAGLTGETRSFSYDSAARLIGAAFQATGAPAPYGVDSWLIDGVGNQAKKVEDGQTTALNVRANGRYMADAMNEVAKLSHFSATGLFVSEDAHTQDPNGNRIKQGEFKLFWDAFDRLVRVVRVSTGQTVGRYRYDASSRRVDRQFRVGGGPLQQVYHVHDGAQEVEELDAAGNVQADFVWGGLYIDEIVQLRRGGNAYYLHQNSIFSVVAATDSTGNVAERYSYSSVYGVCAVQNADGSARSASSEIGNPWRFQGRRYDPETGLYYFRMRYLDPKAGRWVNRDPLGIWGDAGQLGNAYSAFGNDPVNGMDPFGLEENESAFWGGVGGFFEGLGEGAVILLNNVTLHQVDMLDQLADIYVDEYNAQNGTVGGVGGGDVANRAGQVGLAAAAAAGVAAVATSEAVAAGSTRAYVWAAGLVRTITTELGFGGTAGVGAGGTAAVGAGARAGSGKTAAAKAGLDSAADAAHDYLQSFEGEGGSGPNEPSPFERVGNNDDPSTYERIRENATPDALWKRAEAEGWTRELGVARESGTGDIKVYEGTKNTITWCIGDVPYGHIHPNGTEPSFVDWRSASFLKDQTPDATHVQWVLTRDTLFFFGWIKGEIYRNKVPFLPE